MAGSLATIVLSAQGSGAIASEMIPVLVQSEPVTAAVEAGRQVHFVAEPVVQQVPGNPAPAVENSDDDAATLQEAVADQPVDDTLGSQLRCLASAIYFEARGESLEGQLAVGRVIVNRSQSGRFPASYCGVVLQPSQFSFLRGGRIPGAREASRDWREAVAIARIADAGSWASPAKGALFFHATRVSPRWRLQRIARVDNHVFYR
ncbi:cell wall hydrolase [Novosphingobium colocasiae]|uniref:cell wall hydrolase n=1 Tax=Novosphingobium colocasiae TaxID=1256513 RepID=UPI0027E59B35|nr:cell wall hydrolase [Novosphingobium colocasiae]